MGGAAPEPPAPSVQVGRVERGLLPRRPRALQGRARVPRAPAPLMGALAGEPRLSGPDGVRVQRAYLNLNALRLVEQRHTPFVGLPFTRLQRKPLALNVRLIEWW